MWQSLYAYNKCWQLPAQQLFPSNAGCDITQISECQREIRAWMKSSWLKGCLEKMLPSLVRGSNQPEGGAACQQQPSGDAQTFSIQRKANILASLRGNSDKKLLLSQWEVVLASFQHDGAAVIQVFGHCSCMFGWRGARWAPAYAMHRSLAASLIPVGTAACCSLWASCNHAFALLSPCSLKKGQSCQADKLGSCTVDHSEKLMFPFSAVPVLHFLSPDILPVLLLKAIHL